MSSNPPVAGLAGRFLTIIDRLCQALAAHAVRDWTATAFVHIIVQNLRRRLERFVALKARFDAGVPPPLPRSSSARGAADGAASERAFDFVPRTRGWLLTTAQQDGASIFWQFRDLLAEPEMAEFMAADPRVGRLLRPLWWMLSPKLGLPDILRLPARPAARQSKTARDSRSDPPATARTASRSRDVARAWARVARRSGSGPPIPA